MLGIIISAAILCGLMHFVARNEAEYSFPRVLIISAVISLLSLVLNLALGPLGGLVTLAALVYALHEYCYLRWHMAGIVAGLFLVISVGINLALARALHG